MGAAGALRLGDAGRLQVPASEGRRGDELSTEAEREEAMKRPDDGSRRRFLKTSSMLGLAAVFSQGKVSTAFAEKEDAMTPGSATATEQALSIRPFHVDFPETELTDLRRRVNATKWPQRETVQDPSQGVQL